ncbi:rhomboid family intramembrane serine protease [Lacunimicrobium album]
MRLLGTQSDEQLAVRFWNYLESQKISSRLDRDADGFHIWVISEDDVDRAKSAYSDYLIDPKNEKFNAADKLTAELKRIRSEAEKKAKKANSRQRTLPWQTRQQNDIPVTILLIVISVTVSLLTSFGQSDSRLSRSLHINDGMLYRVTYQGEEVIDRVPVHTLPDITEKGQIWRLISPIFLHLSPMHLVFNMIMTFQFGSLIERRKGSLFILLQVLFVGVLSNLLQFYFTDPGFGGMSGVLYGFFGYVWMKGVVSPEEGLGADQQTVFVLLVWFVICMLSVGVANYAHAAGLFLGMFLGAAPGVYRGRKRFAR